ncbi:hypothetical protein RR46_06780 [Papilio xuthus]|uniref:Uncharacterized protein n=1 Tax=Papilio xuthus TaxID=66420 RepID=A0A194PRG6_PAPXU|nr:hypothetical protein RR46_06780 [Papilio xuthus]
MGIRNVINRSCIGKIDCTRSEMRSKSRWNGNAGCEWPNLRLRETQHYHRLGINTSPSPAITPVLRLREEDNRLFLYALKRTVDIYTDNALFVQQAKDLFRYLCEVRVPCQPLSLLESPVTGIKRPLLTSSHNYKSHT